MLSLTAAVKTLDTQTSKHPTPTNFDHREKIPLELIPEEGFQDNPTSCNGEVARRLIGPGYKLQSPANAPSQKSVNLLSRNLRQEPEPRASGSETRRCHSRLQLQPLLGSSLRGLVSPTRTRPPAKSPRNVTSVSQHIGLVSPCQTRREGV